MENLLHLGLSNAVASIGLALAAVAATLLMRRRPALIHGLWLLVLLKLFTPPLVRLPAPWLANTSAPVESAPTMTRIETPDEYEAAVPVLAYLRVDDEQTTAKAPKEIAIEPSGAVEPSLYESVTVAPAAAQPSTASPGWMWAVGVLWAAGSGGWFLLAAVRVIRFRRLLRFAEAAPEALCARAARLAQRLGLRRCPTVWLVPGRLSPMLWAAGGAPRLLVPAGLLGQVRDDQLDTLLLHELAHLRRRDHWVRGLEFLAMGLYWWNPVVWWARRELREAEEQCCDAWVVSVLSCSRRAYAEALVGTLDFLSHAPAATPLLASGIGHVADLKRRLTMILSGTTPRALTWRGGLTMLGLAALLPLLPAWVRAEPPAPEKKVVEFELHFENLQLVPGTNIDAVKAQTEAQQLEAELQKKRAEVKALEQRLKAVQDMAKKPDVVRSVPAKPVADSIWLDLGTGGQKFVLGNGGFYAYQLKPGAAQKGTLYELVPGEKGTLILRPVAPPLKETVRDRVEQPGVVLWKVAPGQPAPVDSRTKNLQKRLDELMKELEQLKKELKSTPNPYYGPVPKSDVKPAPKPEKLGEEARRLNERHQQLKKVLGELQKAIEREAGNKE